MSDSMPKYNNDQGLSEGTVENVSQEVIETPQETMNPIWADALKEIPDEFHSRLTPTFKNWDSKFEAERNKLNAYTPYQALVDNNVPFEHVDQAMELANLFRSSPRDVYDYLGRQYNFGTPPAVEEEKEPENFDLGAESKYDLERDPRFIQVAQQAQFANQRFEQAEQQRINAEMTTQVQSEVEAVKQAFPMLDIADVANMALGMSQNSNSMPDLMAAAQKMGGYIPQPRASDGAPPSISGNRGLPSSQVNFGAMTPEERSNFIASAMRASAEQ